MVLKRGIYHVSKGERYGDFNTMILPGRSTYFKVRASHMLAGRTKCCLVYELVDQRNENKPLMGYHQVFIVVRVSIRPLVNSYKASAVMFMAKDGQFTGKKEDMKRLKRTFYESTWSIIHILLYVPSEIKR
jgi:hypothetical protein